MRQLIRQTITHPRRPPRPPAISSMVLAFVGGLTLLMPVNYRAGTDHAHAHTTFQLWIDAATGQSHHHHGDKDQQHVARSAHGSNAHRHTDVVVTIGDAPASEQPDTAEPVSSHMPVQHANAIGALGVLIALLSVVSVLRSCWPGGRRLTGVAHLLDPPPPRFAPC